MIHTEKPLYYKCFLLRCILRLETQGHDSSFNVWLLYALLKGWWAKHSTSSHLDLYFVCFIPNREVKSLHYIYLSVWFHTENTRVKQNISTKAKLECSLCVFVRNVWGQNWQNHNWKKRAKCFMSGQINNMEWLNWNTLQVKVMILSHIPSRLIWAHTMTQ